MNTLHLEKCTSTNDVAKDILTNNINDVPPVLIIAEKQTKGRGRSGSWWSPEGAGLYMNVIRPVIENFPHQHSEAIYQSYNDPKVINDFTTINIGYALRNVLKRYFLLTVELKNINDIYLAGRKLAGILCEYHPDTEKLIIGIGVNLFRPTKVTKLLQKSAVWLNEYAAECRIDKLKLAEIIAEEVLKL
jgi:BirA family transcriptional regulator, biotin operon repressor / biotin---[acetyl-CoA-carboxylase] ligase